MITENPAVIKFCLARLGAWSSAFPLQLPHAEGWGTGAASPSASRQKLFSWQSPK